MLKHFNDCCNTNLKTKKCIGGSRVYCPQCNVYSELIRINISEEAIVNELEAILNDIKMKYINYNILYKNNKALKNGHYNLAEQLKTKYLLKNI